MANTLEISLSYQPESSQLCVKILQETISSDHPDSFAVVYILPDRKSSSRSLLTESLRTEMILEVDPSTIMQAILEIFVYDVSRSLPPQNILGITSAGAPLECLGSIHVHLANVNAATTASIKEELVKCELRGIKAQNTCDLLRFKEDTQTFWKKNVPNATISTFVNNKVVQPAVDYALSEIETSRAPVLYLIGRSGEGKSSLINGLANKYVAEVGDLAATTPTSKDYFIEFEGGTTWQVYDTRGLSETTTPDGAKEDPVTQVKREIINYKPDAIVFVVSAKGIRNCFNELNILAQILSNLQSSQGSVPPVITVITHADTLRKTKDWPPEEFPPKQEILTELLDRTAKDIMHAKEYSCIDPEKPYCGYTLKGDKPVLFVVPVALPPKGDGEVWNVETLSLVVGRMLPKEAKLQFYQAQKRPMLMKEYTDQSVVYFSSIATVIGATPIPISDTLLLTVLQFLMISYIAWKSGRELSLKVASEYVCAMGLTFVAGQGCLAVAQALIKFVPVLGSIVGASISGASTYAMGKSAQTYFFEGKLRDPNEFEKEASDQAVWHNPPTTSR